MRQSTNKKPYKVGCSRYLQRFDEHIMKPIFIYRYHRLKAKDAEDFFNVMLEEGNTLEAMYKHQGQKAGTLRVQKTHINHGKTF